MIAPALAAGRVVVSDRYLLANIVYQGDAGGLLEEEIALVGMVATAGLMPDLTIVLDIAPEAARGVSALPATGSKNARCSIMNEFGPAIWNCAGPARRRSQETRGEHVLSGADRRDRCVARIRDRLRGDPGRGCQPVRAQSPGCMGWRRDPGGSRRKEAERGVARGPRPRSNRPVAGKPFAAGTVSARPFVCGPGGDRQAHPGSEAGAGAALRDPGTPYSRALSNLPRLSASRGGHAPGLHRSRTPEERQELPISVVRDLCAQFAYKPARGVHKVAILDDADDLNEEASNAFLKTLEEPPPGAV